MNEEKRIIKEFCEGVEALEALAKEAVAAARASGDAGKTKTARKVRRMTKTFHADLHDVTETAHDDGDLDDETAGLITTFGGGDK